MSGGPLAIEQVLARLGETPRRILDLTHDLTPAELQTPPRDGEWSANDVLAHLRSCADVWGACIATMLNEERPTLRAINPTTWIERTNYPDLEFQPSLNAFETQRAELLAILAPLSQEGWSRTATLTGAGAPIERTVESFARRLVRHERPHLKQIERTIEALKRGGG